MASQSSKAPKRKKPQGHASKHIAHRPINKKSSSKHKFKSSKNPNLIPLGKNKILNERSKVEEAKKAEEVPKGGGSVNETCLLSTIPASQQLQFFLHRFQSANGLKLSPLEVEAFKDTCMVELTQDMDQDVDHFNQHVKSTFGTSWREVLSDGKLSEGTVDSGSPALLVISSSALRSLELLRGLKTFTGECRPVKLFAKHMKVEDQAKLLKTRVNIACGTPSRIKKLIDMDAMLLSRLAIVVLDMNRDAKGYSLLTLPQVSAEFWDLYKSHFQHRLQQGDTRICFYGPVPSTDIKKATQSG